MQEQSEEAKVVFHLLYHAVLLVIEMLVVLLILSAIAGCCKVTYQCCYEASGSVSKDKAPGRDIDFLVEEDDTMFQVAKRLAKEGLVVNPYSFYTRTLMMEREKTKLYPGSYLLNTAMDYEEIIDRLTVDE